MNRMKVRIAVGQHAWFDFLAPEGFDFGRFCAEIRERGYWYNGENSYVPYARIECVLYMPEAQLDGLESVHPMGKAN